MNEIRWNGAQPLNLGTGAAAMSRVLAAIRRTDAVRSLLEAPALDEISKLCVRSIPPNERAGLKVVQTTIDAREVERRAMDRACAVLKRVLNSSSGTVKVDSFNVAKQGMTHDAVGAAITLNLSDGQVIAIYLHIPCPQPDQAPPGHDLIPRVWLLNKMDVTAVVSPEGHEGVDLQTVSRRMLGLAQVNSAAFLKKQVKAQADAAAPAMTPRQAAANPRETEAQARYLRKVLRAQSPRDQDVAFVTDVVAGRIDLTAPDIADRLKAIVARNRGASAVEVVLRNSAQQRLRHLRQ